MVILERDKWVKHDLRKSHTPQPHTTYGPGQSLVSPRRRPAHVIKPNFVFKTLTLFFYMRL